MEVTTPVRAITYDVVSSPSHGNARIMTFLKEDFTGLLAPLKDTLTTESGDQILFESFDNLIFEGDNLNTPDSSKQECSAYLKTVIREHFHSLKPFILKI